MAESLVDDELWQEFHDLVNMTSRELGDWLREAEADLDQGLRHLPLLRPTVHPTG